MMMTIGMMMRTMMMLMMLMMMMTMMIIWRAKGRRGRTLVIL